MKRIFIFLCSFIFFSVHLFSQAPEIGWQNTVDEGSGGIIESFSFDIYPNTSSDLLFVDLENDYLINTAEIFDITGNKIENISYDNNFKCINK